MRIFHTSGQKLCGGKFILTNNKKKCVKDKIFLLLKLKNNLTFLILSVDGER